MAFDKGKRFEEGTIVYLKTWSPQLLVEYIRHDDVVSVVWFDGTDAIRDSFHKAALTEVKPQEK